MAVKFVEATYHISSVFKIPADWDTDKIYVKWNKLMYMDGDKEIEIEPVIDATEFDFKRPSDLEITADKEIYDSKDFKDEGEE